MIHFVNYNLKCWICGNEADSREHKHKKTDVNRAFKNVPTNDKYIGVFKSGEIERHVQGVDSKLLKFEKVICQRCNNQSSQPHDFAYEKFLFCF